MALLFFTKLVPFQYRGELRVGERRTFPCLHELIDLRIVDFFRLFSAHLKTSDRQMIIRFRFLFLVRLQDRLPERLSDVPLLY